MPDILLATPVHGAQVTTFYVDAVLQLLQAVRGRDDFNLRHSFIDSALVGWARNAYATAVLERPAISHLLFIDADIGFQPSAVLRLLEFDKPFVGCIYPARTMDEGRRHEIARQVDDPPLARRVAQDYVATGRLAQYADGRLAAEGGFVRTERLGMGLTLLRRDALERLAAAHPELWAPADRGYANMGLGERVFQPFTAYKAENGLYMSEDLSFARRWTDLGGEIWACLDEELTHAGITAFTGAYAERLRFEGALPPA